MPSEQNQERTGFSDILSKLHDSDVVIETTMGTGARRAPDLHSVQLVQDAVETSYRALAGSIRVEFESLAVLEEHEKRSLSRWLRAEVRESDSDDSDSSLLKFL